MDTSLDFAVHYFINLLNLITVFICIVIESFIFLHNINPQYHLLPTSFILVYPIVSKLYKSNVYMLNFSCLKPSPQFRVPRAKFIEHISLSNCPKESISFMSKLILTSSIGEETCLPPSLHYIPPLTRYHDSISEAQMLLFPVFQDLLLKTNISAYDIDILVVNCSGFCSSPSLSSLVISRFNMRENVKSFNISGMGCSASAIGIDIANNLLKSCVNSYAVVISTEVLSNGWYKGKDERKLIVNCTFRTGSSAVLLTNRRKDMRKSKYKLVHLHRTQLSFDDYAYKSAIREEDYEGITGFTVERYLVTVAARTLRSNLETLGPLILPMHEMIKYLLKRLSKPASSSSVTMVPNFKSVIQHYCLPGSGKTVIEEIGRGLGLDRKEMEAALATIYRYGNQSSSSMWYQLAYIEATSNKGVIREGEKLLQLGMGSGPKCNSVVWESLGRNTKVEKETGPWFDYVHQPFYGSS